MNILAIGAHPDDIEFGCGGTLLKYIRNGHDVYLLVMTEGHRGGPARSRQGEQQRAARILKPKELIWGTYRDTELSPKMNEMVQDIESVLDRIQPQFTFVHYEEDTHQDHRALAKAAVSATRYVKNVLFYEGPTSQNFTPTVFVDVKDTLEEKIKLLLAHILHGRAQHAAISTAAVACSLVHQITKSCQADLVGVFLNHTRGLVITVRILLAKTIIAHVFQHITIRLAHLNARVEKPV